MRQEGLLGMQKPNDNDFHIELKINLQQHFLDKECYWQAIESCSVDVEQFNKHVSFATQFNFFQNISKTFTKA